MNKYSDKLFDVAITKGHPNEIITMMMEIIETPEVTELIITILEPRYAL